MPSVLSSIHGDRSASVRFQMEALQPFLELDGVTEICVNRPNEVFYEVGGEWHRQDVPGLGVKEMKSLAIAVAALSRNEISDTRPILSAVLPDGERAQFVMPPACEEGTLSVTIRKPSFVIRSIDDYNQQGFFANVRPLSEELAPEERELLALKDGQDYMGFLKRAVALGKVIVIAGETGSGKTTFMKGLMQLIPPSKRIITIEDVRELFLPNHPNHVHLFYPSEGSQESGAVVTSAGLLRSCLRMKPDRILLAELRGAEAFDFVNVCASGHGGSITSAHAGSAELTFERLALMILQNPQGRELPYEVIRKLLYLVVDVVLHVHNDVDGAHGRHITELWYDPMRKRERAGQGGMDPAGMLALQARMTEMGSRVSELEAALFRSRLEVR